MRHRDGQTGQGPLFSSPWSGRWATVSLRPVARAGLVRIGTPALTFLADALADRATPFEVRLHIPRSISRFTADEASLILLRELRREKDLAVRFKIVRGLGRLRADSQRSGLTITFWS